MRFACVPKGNTCNKAVVILCCGLIWWTLIVYYVNYDSLFNITFQNAWLHTFNWQQEFFPLYQRGTVKHNQAARLLSRFAYCAFSGRLKKAFMNSLVRLWSSFSNRYPEAAACMHLFRLWCNILPQTWVSLMCALQWSLSYFMIPCSRWNSPFLILHLPVSGTIDHLEGLGGSP